MIKTITIQALVKIFKRGVKLKKRHDYLVLKNWINDKTLYYGKAKKK